MTGSIVNLAPPGRRPSPEKLSPLAAVWRGMEALLGRLKALEAKRPREVASARISDTGNLVLNYSDGTESDLGRVVGRDGVSPTEQLAALSRLAESLTGRVGTLEQVAPPRSVASARITDAGDLIVTYSDGAEANLGRVVPPSPAPVAPPELLARIAALEAAISARPRKKKTTVTKKNDDGTIAEFIQEETD